MLAFQFAEKLGMCSLYPDQLLMCYYTVRDCSRLQNFILSPKAVIDEKDDSIMVCKECKSTLQHNLDTSKAQKHNKLPKEAIANRFLIGEAPEEFSGKQNSHLRPNMDLFCWMSSADQGLAYLFQEQKYIQCSTTSKFTAEWYERQYHGHALRSLHLRSKGSETHQKTNIEKERRQYAWWLGRCTRRCR